MKIEPEKVHFSLFNLQFFYSAKLQKFYGCVKFIFCFKIFVRI